MRMWEIREGHEDHSKESAYKCGYEDGYADAMKEYRAFRESDTRYKKS